MAIPTKQRKIIAFQTEELKNVFDRIVMAGTTDGSVSESRFIINTVLDSFLPKNTDMRLYMYNYLAGKGGEGELMECVFQQASLSYNVGKTDLTNLLHFCFRTCYANSYAPEKNADNIAALLRHLKEYIRTKPENPSAERCKQVIYDIETDPNTMELAEYWDLLISIYRDAPKSRQLYRAAVYLCRMSTFWIKVEQLTELTTLINDLSEQFEENEQNEKDIHKRRGTQNDL